jgi:hypothetical protein
MNAFLTQDHITFTRSQWLALTMSLSHQGLLVLTHLTYRLQPVNVEGIEGLGWDPLSGNVLRTWGVPEAAQRKGFREVCSKGYVRKLINPVTKVQFGLAGTQMLSWLSNNPPATFQKMTNHFPTNARGDFPISDKTATTSRSSSKSTTNSTSVDLRLFDALSQLSLEQLTSVVDRLFSKESSAAAWQPWRDDEMFASQVGTAPLLAKTLESLTRDPGSAKAWCETRGVRVPVDSFGLALASRVIFALIAATTTRVRNGPAAWVAHMAKPTTDRVVNESVVLATELAERLARSVAATPVFAPSPVLSAPEISGDQGANIIELPVNTRVNDQRVQQLGLVIPSLLAGKGDPRENEHVNARSENGQHA